MSLQLLEPPPESRETIRAALSGLLSQPDTHTFAAMAGVSTNELSLALPHRTYFVAVDSIVAGTLAETSKFSGWRYIVLDGDQPIIATELSLTPNRERFEFSHASDGPFVIGTVEGIRRAEKLRELSKLDFEVRLLEVPALGVVTLWFHAVEEDLYMPLPPVRRDLVPYKLYTEAALVAALQYSAAKRLQIKDDRA